MAHPCASLFLLNEKKDIEINNISFNQQRYNTEIILEKKAKKVYK